MTDPANSYRSLLCLSRQRNVPPGSTEDQEQRSIEALAEEFHRLVDGFRHHDVDENPKIPRRRIDKVAG
jgi:hypothetical protein